MWPRFFAEFEKKLPSQYKQIASQFSYVFLFRVLQQIVNFVSFFFIVHHVPQDVIGHYSFVMSFVSLISMTSLPGMQAALLQSIARNRGGFYKIALRYGVWGSIAGSLILLGMAGYNFMQGNMPMACAFVIAAFLNPAANGLLVWKSSFSGEEKFKALSACELTNTMAVSILLAASALFYSDTPVLLVLIALVVPAFQNLVLSIREYKKYIDAPDYEDGMIEYGLKASAYQAFPILSREIDKLCIYNFMSAAELALYNVAMKIPEAIKAVIQNLGDIILPKFARMEKYSGRLDNVVKIVSRVIFAGIVIFSITLLPIFFRILVPEAYHETIPYMQVLMLSVAIGNQAVISSKYIMSQNDIVSYKKFTVASAMVKIVLTPFLVFFFHIWGAVASIVVQRIVISIYTRTIIRQHHL